MDGPNSRLIGETYSDIIDMHYDPAYSSKKATKYAANDEQPTHVFDSSQVPLVLKQKILKIQYPSDLTSANIFCLVCGKLVNSSDSFSAYESEAYMRRFLVHDSCFTNDFLRSHNDLYTHVQDVSYVPFEKASKLNGNQQNPMSIQMGDRQFCIQMNIVHPLSGFKFIKLVTKQVTNQNVLQWSLRREQNDQPTFEPNIIAFPFIDFKVSIIVSEIGTNMPKSNIDSYINLSRVKHSSSKSFLAKSEQATFLLNIYSSSSEKQQIISAMNYKYRYPQKLNLPIVELESIEIHIPEEKYEEEGSNATININQLLTDKAEQSSQASSHHLFSNVPRSYYDYEKTLSNHSKNERVNYSQSDIKMSDNKSSSAQKERVDFDKLISTGKLSAFVKNGTQSRAFQKFLDEATTDQIELIIGNFYDQFPDLVIDDYANYTTQKLFQRCLPAQRLLIIKKLYPQIPNLVRNKQGTHTIQAFVSYLTLPQEIQLVVESIKQEFESLCFNSISTHFIQKIIKIFPIQSTIEFYYEANRNFLRFATDKNAMCVLKYMLRRVKQHEQNQVISEMKKHFINSITLNTHKIIQDCYGNYVIQFCYQLFGQARSSGITQMILQKFVQFSLQKYSSSVVSKCINIYWQDKSYAFKLKQTLNSEGILQMYRNKDGNKILLDLMDKNENTALWDKINNILIHSQVSKFYHDRWGAQIGIRSGPVGYEFCSFAEADKQQRSGRDGKKKKK